MKKYTEIDKKEALKALGSEYYDSATYNSCVVVRPPDMDLLEECIDEHGHLVSDFELLAGALKNPQLRALVDRGYFRVIPAVNNAGDLFDPAGQNRGAALSTLHQVYQGVIDELNAPPAAEPAAEASAPAEPAPTTESST